MKYCPYCGASLVGGAASFCAECGKKIPAQTEAPQSKPKPKGKMGERERPAPKQKAPKPSNRPGASGETERNPMDINYDGYYDDVKPVDAGEQEEGVDPEMVKKVAILLAGVFAVILASVALMMLL